MLSGILLAKVFDMTSDSGGHPTGVTEFISSFFIRFTAYRLAKQKYLNIVPRLRKGVRMQKGERNGLAGVISRAAQRRNHRSRTVHIGPGTERFR